MRPGAVCAVGWEPNPAHTSVLASLEEAYNKCGWKVGIRQLLLAHQPKIVHQPLFLHYQLSLQVKIYTETGVGAQHHTSRFKAIDYVKKGDGESNKKWQAIYLRTG